MKTYHLENCNSQIYKDLETPEAIWYAGEEVCNKKPEGRIQKMQNSLNWLLKRNKLENPERAYTANELHEGQI